MFKWFIYLYIITEEAEYFASIRKLLETPTEVLEIIKLLIFPATAVPQQLFDGATKTMVRTFLFLFLLFYMDSVWGDTLHICGGQSSENSYYTSKIKLFS